MSFLRASVWLDGESCRTLGEVRRFVKFCDELGLSDDTKIDESLLIDLKVAGIAPMQHQPTSLVVSLQT